MKRILKCNGTLIIGDPTAPVVIRQVLNLYYKLSNTGDYKVYHKNKIEELLIKSGFKPSNF